MIPTDMMPQRVPGPAVNGVGQKGGNKNSGGREDVSFAHAMKKVAGDKDASTQATGGEKMAKVGALGRWHRLELRDALAADAEKSSDEADALGADEAGGDGETEDAGAAQDVAASGITAANSILSVLRLHGHPHSGPGAGQAKDEPGVGSAQGVDAADGDADARGLQSVANVKVGNVKVETHLGGSRTEAAAASSAEGLAHLSTLVQGETKKTDAAANGITVPGRDKQPVQKEDVGAAQMPAEGGAPQPVAGLPDQTGAQSFRQEERREGAGLKPGAEVAEVRGPKVVDETASGATPGVSTPLQQIGPQITSTAHEMKAQAAEAATAATSTPADTGNTGPVRVLNIDLHPADLGSVSVRMSMHGDVLGVQIEAERPETARMLQSDQSALTDMLRTAGLQVDGITVRAANMDTVSAGAGSSQANMQQSDSQSGGAQPDARASGGNGQGRDAQSFAGRQGERGQPDNDRPQRGPGSGLYI